MRVDADGTVVLSRRNLLSLLHKLDMEGSRRTLIAPGFAVVVRAEQDEEHYKGREVGPGPMHPETEAFIKQFGAPKAE